MTDPRALLIALAISAAISLFVLAWRYYTWRRKRLTAIARLDALVRSLDDAVIATDKWLAASVRRPHAGG